MSVPTVASAPAFSAMVFAERAMSVGVSLTVKVAALLVADPAVLVNTARYWLPLSPDSAVKL